MSNYGHNEATVRLAGLATDAQIALDKVASGEADAIEGWLAYGAALNEGRALFPGDKEFSAWMAEWQVAIQVEPHERSAAMWAAANADQLAEAKAASRARTLRGWHDQWKKIEAEREAAQKKAEREAAAEKARQEAEAAKKAEDDARAVAASAKTTEERKEAEAKAEKAAVAKAEAEKVIADAEHVEKDEEPAPEVAKVMRELAKLTPEAVADEVIGLRADLADAKSKIASLKADNDRLKEQLADLTNDDRATVIRKLQASLKNAENAKWRATEDTQRAMKQVYALKKRVEELEQMGIPLN